MRALLLTIGSRGDVEPFCALAKELLEHGHEVELFLEPNWRHLTEPLVEEFGSENVSVHNLPFTNASFFPNGASLDSLVDIQANYILPCFSELYQVATNKNCHCLVANSIASYLMVLVAKRTNLPTILIHLQPLLPNQIFPSYRLDPRQFCDAIRQYHDNLREGLPVQYQPEYVYQINQSLYQALLKDGLMERSCQARQQQQHNAIPPVKPYSWQEIQPILAGCHPQFTIANAYSNHLIPKMEGTPGIGTHVKDVGPLADNYISSSSLSVVGLPDDVQSFLNDTKFQENGKPIAIGFGSMPVPKEQVDAVWQALKALPETQRVILIGRALTPPATLKMKLDQPHRFLHVISIPYPLLLPQCSMMVCHGGAGVLQACLTAGVPSLVCPVMGDQFALAAVVHTLQYGRQACRRFVELTANDLIRGIQYLQQHLHISDNCQWVAREIRRENEASRGTAKLRAIMEQAVAGQSTE